MPFHVPESIGFAKYCRMKFRSQKGTALTTYDLFFRIDPYFENVWIFE
jgi:hypothetical protein